MISADGRLPACLVCGRPGREGHADLKDRLFGSGGNWRLLVCGGDDGCGLWWLDPVPSPDEVAAAYRTYYTHEGNSEGSRVPLRRLLRWLKRGYYARHFGYHQGQTSNCQRAFGRVLSLAPDLALDLDYGVFRLPLVPGGRLLEVGCGAGTALRRLAELGWSVTGLDFDERVMAVARQGGLLVELGDLVERGYPGASFDAVVTSHVIEHVPEPAAFLAECRRVLRPGGVTVHITPNAGGWGHRLFGRDWRGLEPPRHLHIFTRAALDSLARAAGFAGVDCGTTGRGREILRQSLLLRHPALGRSRSGAGLSALLAQALVVAARLGRFWDPEAGEELVLTARRPRTGVDERD
jgi:2-polyprenyl-3-methyl-5-hydroxy-6-metoxy-1,4-benzoquinol methylase